jgi:predicted transcriptional regulator
LLYDEGWTPQQIAKVLLISDQAVRNHVEDYKASSIPNVIQKLGILQEGCTHFFLGVSDHCASTRRKRKKKMGCKADAAKNQLLIHVRYKLKPESGGLRKNFQRVNPRSLRFIYKNTPIYTSKIL